jgi:transglutaminase-like putative cysteine protease
VLREHEDIYGNPVAFFAVEGPHRRLSVTSRAAVEVAAPPPLPARSPAWETVRDGIDALPIEVFDFVVDSPLAAADPAYASYAAGSFPAGRGLVEGLVDLTHRLHRDLEFAPGETTVATPIADVFRERRGVCQDFAHLQIACLRSLGLPARYVSGYLETSPPADEPRLVGVDASHAWIAVYVPGTGWLDADPTNDRVPVDRHVTLAWGRDYADVSPLRGVILGGGEQRTRVSVDLVRRE